MHDRRFELVTIGGATFNCFNFGRFGAGTTSVALGDVLAAPALMATSA